MQPRQCWSVQCIPGYRFDHEAQLPISISLQATLIGPCLGAQALPGIHHHFRAFIITDLRDDLKYTFAGASIDSRRWKRGRHYRRRSNRKSLSSTNSSKRSAETQLNGPWLGGYKHGSGPAMSFVGRPCPRRTAHAVAIRHEEYSLDWIFRAASRLFHRAENDSSSDADLVAQQQYLRTITASAVATTHLHPTAAQDILPDPVSGRRVAR